MLYDIHVDSSKYPRLSSLTLYGRVDAASTLGALEAAKKGEWRWRSDKWRLRLRVRLRGFKFIAVEHVKRKT